LVKSFKQRCLTKLATQNNKTNQKSVDLRTNWKTKKNQPKIAAAVHIFWLSLPKQNYYSKFKICQQQNHRLF